MKIKSLLMLLKVVCYRMSNLIICQESDKTVRCFNESNALVGTVNIKKKNIWTLKCILEQPLALSRCAKHNTGCKTAQLHRVC